MAITKSAADEIFRKVMAAHPLPCRLVTFNDPTDHKDKIGKDPPSSAYFTANAIYMILSEMKNQDRAIFLITHEVGHQLFDPGSMYAVMALNLILVKHAAYKHVALAGLMRLAQNIYSDIVVNCVNWEDPGYSARFPGSLDKANIEIYALDPQKREQMRDNPANAMKLGLINAFEGFEWFKIHEPQTYVGIREKVRRAGNPHWLIFETIERLIKDRDFATVDPQKYYDVAIPMMMEMNRLFAAGGSAGGAHL